VSNLIAPFRFYNQLLAFAVVINACQIANKAKVRDE
jgi:hypothetical protein